LQLIVIAIYVVVVVVVDDDDDDDDDEINMHSKAGGKTSLVYRTTQEQKEKENKN